MKVGVVTVYQSYNCGSFLQAYALQEVLKESGNEVFFVKNKFSNRSKLWFILLQAVKYVCTGKAYRAKHLLKIYSNFKKARKAFHVVSRKTKFDARIYGSDTIWNLNDPCFGNDWQNFFGVDFTGKKIAYAASIGSTPVEKLVRRKELCDAVNEFSYIAVRDEETYTFVERCLKSSRDIEYVIDPTMLLSVKDYEKITPVCEHPKCIFVYYFGRVPDNIRKQIREFANKTNRKIVMFGERGDWADVYVSNDPYLMLSYYKHADFIITNTFHGNVFSLIFGKQFIAFGKEKQKVCNLLNRFGLQERLRDEQEDVSFLFEKKIEYDEIANKIAIETNKAKEFLKKALEEDK